MKKRSSVWILSILCLLVLIVSSLLAWFVWLKPAAVKFNAFTQIGANVTAAGNIPQDTKAVPINDKSPFKMAPLSPIIRITPTGKIDGMVTLRFKLNKPTPIDRVLFAMRTSPKDQWTLVKPTGGSPNGWYAEVKTNHFSDWFANFFNYDEGIGVLKQFFDGLTGDALASAEKPQCNNESQAREDGYTIRSDTKDTLYWCFGVEDGKRVLKLVNRKPYPLEVWHPGLTTLHQEYNLDFDKLARFGSGQESFLFPYEEVDYVLNKPLKPGEKAGITTTFSGYAQALYRLETGVSALTMILGHFGAADESWSALKSKKGFELIFGIVGKLIKIKECTNSLFPQPNIGKLISACLEPSKVADIFGWKGVLAAPFIVTGPLFQYFRSEIESAVDTFKHGDQYTVLITRADPADVLATYVGTWHVHGYDLTIKQDYTGQDIWHAGFTPTGEWCNGNDIVMFTVRPDGSLLGTIQSTWYTPSDNECPHGIAQVGDSFTLIHKGDHLLYKTWSIPSLSDYPNYLCDPYAAQKSLPECGA